MAFAAGTGVLCFVDLVASMIRQDIGLRVSHSSINSNPTENTDLRNTSGADIKISKDINDDSFQLHLYVSFPTRE